MMVSKYIVASFAVTLTSALEALRGHELLVFIGLYSVHMIASSVVLRRPPVPVRTNRAASPRLQQWASRQSTTFTSF